MVSYAASINEFDNHFCGKNVVAVKLRLLWVGGVGSGLGSLPVGLCLLNEFIEKRVLPFAGLDTVKKLKIYFHKKTFFVFFRFFV